MMTVEYWLWEVSILVSDLICNIFSCLGCLTTKLIDWFGQITGHNACNVHCQHLRKVNSLFGLITQFEYCWSTILCQYVLNLQIFVQTQNFTCMLTGLCLTCEAKTSRTLHVVYKWRRCNYFLHSSGHVTWKLWNILFFKDAFFTPGITPVSSHMFYTISR